LVRQTFEQFATGQYALEEIANYAFDIGLRSKDRKSAKGNISVNTWRNRHKDMQYIGIFSHEGGKIAGGL